MGLDGIRMSNTETIGVPEVMRRLGCCRSTVYQGVKQGDIPGFTIGRKVVIPREAFERMLRGEWTADSGLQIADGGLDAGKQIEAGMRRVLEAFRSAADMALAEMEGNIILPARRARG